MLRSRLPRSSRAPSSRHAVAPALLALATAALGSVACGGGAPPAAPSSASTAVAVAAAPPIDVSAVPEPEGLLVVGRVSKPEAILKTAGNWSRLPLPGAADLVRSISDDAVAEAVDLAQPVEGAVTLGGSKRSPMPLAAFSVAVRSIDDAKAKLGARHKLIAGANGQWFVEGIGKQGLDANDPEDEDEALTCVLAPAASGARLVCGERPALDALVPYLTRTVPRQNWPADIHVEVHPEPAREPLKQVRSQVPIMGRALLGTQSPALGELMEASVNEVSNFVDDARRITFDAQIGDPGAKADVRIEYAQATGFLARLAAAQRDKVGPPPPSFWHLPSETDVAFFGRGTDPKLFDHPRELLGNVFIEATQDAGMPESERKAVRDLVVDRMMTLFTGALVYGKGYDANAVDKAFAARKAVKEGSFAAEDEADRVLGEQVVGWHLLQVAEPIAKVGPMLKDWQTIWNRPAFAAWAKKQSSSKMIAQMRTAALPAGVKLPKETVHLEIVLPRPDLEVSSAAAAPSGRGSSSAPKAAVKKIARKPLVLHVLAVPDQGTSWIAFGLDAKLVGQKVAASLSTAPDGDTLKEKMVVADAFRDAKVNGGGLVSMRGLLVFSALSDRSRTPWTALPGLPSKGAAPIFFTAAAEAPSANAPAGSVVSSFRVSRAVIEDIVRLAISQ